MAGYHYICPVLVGSAVADGGELFAALPIPQSPRVQRRIHEGKPFITHKHSVAQNKNGWATD